MIAAARKKPGLPLAALCAILLASVPTPARASPLDPQMPDNVVLLDLGLHVIGIGYQRTFTRWLALQLDAETYSPWTQNINVLGASPGYGSDLTGLVVRFRPIFMGIFDTPYPADGPPRGAWISPFVQAGLAEAMRNHIETRGTVWAAGLSVGWAWLFADHVTLLLGAGAQYHEASIPDCSVPVTGCTSSIYPPSFARFYPTLDANLGYAF